MDLERPRTFVGFLAWSLCLAALGATGYWMLFSHFAGFDDEGYILISAREYFARGQLYDAVYTQYGPAYYVFLDALQRIIGPLDNTSGRWLTLACWLGTAAACGTIVRRETRSWSLSLFTLGATFLYLYFMPDEPFHPGGPIILSLSVSCLGIVESARRNRWQTAAIIAGATGALLSLTKINVGLFYAAGIGGWALLNAASPALRHAARWLVPAGLIALAGLLMHSLWRESWVHLYLAVFAIGAVTVCASTPGEAIIGRRHAGRFALTFVGVGSVVLLIVHLRGTSWAGLLDGVILRPLRHPGTYSYPVDWRPGTLLVACLSAACLIGCQWLARSGQTARLERVVAGLRVVQGAAIVIAVALLMEARIIGTVFSFVAPVIWIALVTWRNDTAGPSSRALLAFVLLLQYLHAFPVAGSQESWGTFLILPLAALAAGDLRRSLAPRRWSWCAAMLIAVIFAKIGWTAVKSHRPFAEGQPLGLPGAESIRLPEKLRTAHQVVAVNAAAHGDMLFTLPGMNSWNLWTGLPTPTMRNTTLWFSLLNEVEQQEVIRALERNPRACIIVHEILLELMRGGNVTMQGPLLDYVRQQFQPAFRVDRFSFLVHAGRPIAPLNLARHGSSPHEVEFSLVGSERAIASVAVRDLSQPDQPARVVTPSRLTLTPISSSGRPAGEAAAAALPVSIKGLVHLSLTLETGARPATPSDLMLELRDEYGGVISRVLFADP